MDIDIDIKSSTRIDKIFAHWPQAMQIVNGRQIKHPCGVHPQVIPTDPITGLAAIPYKDAATIGYFKIDMLHNSVYSHFESKEEIDALLEFEPPWDLLKSRSIVKQLFQVAKHFDLVDAIKPKSVLELSDVIALIRPGKRHVLNLYLRDRVEGRKQLYSKDDSGYIFKKAHSIAYSQVIVLQLHLINLGIDLS